jgi:hypothetical protein
VAQAQSEIDSAEFSEWVAYHNIEPFIDTRLENMLAIIAAILANSNRTKGKPYPPDDFIPKYGVESKPKGDDFEIKLRAILNGNH